MSSRYIDFVRSFCPQYGASALYPNQGLFEQAYVHWTNFSTVFKNDLYISVLAFTPIGQPQIDISNANGGTAFSPPDGMQKYFHQFYYEGNG